MAMEGEEAPDSDTESGGHTPSEPLPFKCEYEIGVCERDDEDEWDHYHPLARTQAEARAAAKGEARDDGFEDPTVYMADGPYRPENPARVGEEVITRVFG